MKKASLIIHQNYVEEVIKNLHDTGLMEIIDISKDGSKTLEDFGESSIHSDHETCLNYELRVSRLIGILNSIKPKKGGLKGVFNPDLPEIKEVEDFSLEEIYSYTEGVLGEIEKKILEHEEKLQKQNEKIELINHDLEQLEFIKNFDFDISEIGESEYVLVKVGKTTELDSLKAALKGLDKVEFASKQFGSRKHIEWSVLIAAHIIEKDKIEKICREKITEFDFNVSSGRPKELIKKLKDQKTKIRQEKKKIVTDLRVFAKEQLDDLLALREEIYLERVRMEIPKKFGKTNSTFIIKGWVLEKDENKLKESLSQVAKDHIICDFEKPSLNPDNPPVHLKTPNWAKPFRTFLDLFASPKYNEIDPMFFMSIFFVLFFGIMLGDAGYGLVLLILSIFGYFKFKKISETISSWSYMGVWLSIVTIIVGILTNSFFGDLIPRFFMPPGSQQFYSFTIAGINFPIEPLRDPLIILAVSLFFGLLHLNLGIILAIYQSYKRRDYKSLISQHFAWVPIQLGGGMLIGSFLLKMWVLSDLLFYIAIILFIIGIILLLKHAGPLGLFNITGYIGDWLSYARLLALGLGTVGMALAFNIIAQILPDMIPVVGFILTPIILVVAHTANLGIQTLGAGVHSIRLQYVEFFNRFYEGGGRKFEPFSIKRKYTKSRDVE